jgi:hypothetical protein
MTTELSIDVSTPTESFATMLFNPNAMKALTDFGKMMSESKVTIPVHLHGKPADCTAIALQAMQWGFNPYAVAQKTHITQGGALGYEAQLVNAAVISSGKLKARPEFEFIGDWDKILGKVEERKSEKGGKYYVATWDRSLEVGLGVICKVHLVGEAQPREVKVMLSQAWPRFSTQWATDPQQQITYLAVRKMARRYTPDVILGVYTNDELEGPTTVDMGIADEVPPPPPGPQRKSKATPAAAAPTPVADTPAASNTVIDDAMGEISPPPAPAPSHVTTSKPPMPQASAAAGAKLQTGQIAYIRNKLTQAGIDEVVICTRYQISGIDQLSAEQFDELKAELLANS